MTLDLKTVMLGIESTLAHDVATDFFAKQGAIEYNARGQGNRYEPGDTRLGTAGKIIIDPKSIEVLTSRSGSELQAARDIITHELGHFRYALQECPANQGANSLASIIF